MTAHFLFHCLYLLFFIASTESSDEFSPIVKSDLKTTFEENIMLTLKRCSETDAVVTQENSH